MTERLTDHLERMHFKNTSILYSDYRDLSGEELRRAITENTRVAMELVKKGETRQLRLTDLRGAFADQETMEVLKSKASDVAPYVKASAVLGVEGIRRHLLRIVNKISNLGARPFDSLEEAQEWLVSKADDDR